MRFLTHVAVFTLGVTAVILTRRHLPHIIWWLFTADQRGD